MLNIPYPPKPEADRISDKYSDKHSEKFSEKNSTLGEQELNNFAPYPMKPEADNSISIGDDELGTITPQKLSCTEDDFKGTIHSERTGAKKFLFKQKTREWTDLDTNEDKRQPPQLHPAVFKRVNEKGSNYNPWIMKRNPVQEEGIEKISPDGPQPESVT